MPVLQVTMDRKLSANPVPVSPAWKQVCVWMRICIIKESGIGLFFYQVVFFQQCSQCCITGVKLKSEGLGRWERGTKRGSGVIQLVINCRLLIVPQLAEVLVTWTVCSHFCLSYAWHGIASGYVLTDLQSEWVNNNLTQPTLVVANNYVGVIRSQGTQAEEKLTVVWCWRI